jgi:hypothetical protein
VTLEKLDALLAEWKSIMDTAARDLVDLHNLPSYEILVGSSGGSPRHKLAGVTEAHLGPAIFAAEAFMREFGLLSDAIQRANERRQQITRFDRFGSLDQKIADVERVLTKPSIPMPDGTAVAPRQLLAQMNQAFLVAHDALYEVDCIWKLLDGKLANAAAFLKAHADEAATMPLRQQIDSLRSRVITDPMGANADFDRDIQPLLTQTQQAMETLINQRANIRQNVAQGREQLRKLAELRQQADVLHTECKEKITAHALPTPPLPWDRITALADWLTRLEAKLAEGMIDPVCVGFAHWTSHVNDLIAVEERACHENLAPLELRRELRGRLSALKAKAIARGLSEDPRLTEIAERATTMLHVRPTPLLDAVNLVAQFESRLNGRP